MIHSQSTKKILIFSLSYYPYVGGAEVAVKEITDRITDIEFHLITPRFDSTLPSKEQIGNVVVHRVGWGKASPTLVELSTFPLYFTTKMLFPLFSAYKAYKLNKEIAFDAFWIIMAYAGFGVSILRLFGIKKPYILTLQEGDPLETIVHKPIIVPFIPLLKKVFVDASATQAISTYLGKWAHSMGFKGEVAVIPNAVDTTQFSKSSEMKKGEAYEKMKQMKKDTNVWLITTSRLVRKNACDDVIRALADLAPNIHFAVFGLGEDEDMLRELAKATGVQDRVHFFGYVDHAELPACLALADIFIRPSRSEGMGNSFIEAMAMGLPVIATQEGGIADFLFDSIRNSDKNPTGFAVDKDSPKQIAEVVERILSDRGATERTVSTAREMVLTTYAWEKVASSMRDLFAKVLR